MQLTRKIGDITVAVNAAKKEKNMRLSEIAENIVKYHPDCCMAKNYEIINGCREDWYEESLIEPLI